MKVEQLLTSSEFWIREIAKAFLTSKMKVEILSVPKLFIQTSLIFQYKDTKFKLSPDYDQFWKIERLEWIPKESKLIQQQRTKNNWQRKFLTEIIECVKQ